MSLMQGADGVLVPGGFGDRGVQGKIVAASYARTNRIPFLGICLGMQIAVVEFSRNVNALFSSFVYIFVFADRCSYSVNLETLLVECILAE